MHLPKLKWSDSKPAPKYSVAAGISTIPPMLVPAMRIPDDHVVHNSVMQRTNDRVRQGLSVISPISGAIPLIGTPLKASIDTLLMVLNGLNIRGENRKNAENLIRRLYGLEATFSAVPLAAPATQFQRDELARKLNAVSGRLKGMQVKSVFGGADIKEAILDCTREIDQHQHDYTVVALMQLSTQEGAARQLPGSVHQELVFVKDPSGREFKLLVEQCGSRKQFIAFLLCSFGDSDRDKILRDFIDRDAYDLYTESERGTTGLNKWSGVGAGTRVIMSAVFEQSRYDDYYECPRPQCKAQNNCRDAKDGWIECVRCPGRFQITNAERRTGERRSNFGQIPKGSATPVMGGYNLDLIQIFNLRQKPIHIAAIEQVRAMMMVKRKQIAIIEERRREVRGSFQVFIPSRLVSVVISTLRWRRREKKAGHYQPRNAMKKDSRKRKDRGFCRREMKGEEKAREGERSRCYDHSFFGKTNSIPIHQPLHFIQYHIHPIIIYASLSKFSQHFVDR